MDNIYTQNFGDLPQKKFFLYLYKYIIFSILLIDINGNFLKKDKFIEALCLPLESIPVRSDQARNQIPIVRCQEIFFRVLEYSAE